MLFTLFIHNNENTSEPFIINTSTPKCLYLNVKLPNNVHSIIVECTLLTIFCGTLMYHSKIKIDNKCKEINTSLPTFRKL